VNSEFNWWLLIVGLVVGAGLVWLVVADSRRREVDVDEVERDGEAQWIAAAMRDAGRDIDDRDALDILRLHAAYLAASPPDAVWDTGDETLDEDGRWLEVPDGTPRLAVSGGGERQPMAHPIRAERTDHEGGPA
jgi:hypothetical protein